MLTMHPNTAQSIVRQRHQSAETTAARRRLVRAFRRAQADEPSPNGSHPSTLCLATRRVACA